MPLSGLCSSPASASAQQSASRMPLVHVTCRANKAGTAISDLLDAGTHPTTAAGARTSGSDQTRLAEASIWGSGTHFVYFYAGRAHPRYGDAAFAYGPKVEAHSKGEAGPFDSGAMFNGSLSHAKSATTTESERIHLIKSNTRVLGTWRNTFANYLDSYFAGVGLQYLGSTPLPSGGSPVSANFSYGAWIAWTWEIRIGNECSVDDELVAWDCDPAVRSDFEDYALYHPASKGVAKLQNTLLSRTTTQLNFQSLDQWISAQL
jgi:hypothetical protein